MKSTRPLTSFSSLPTVFSNRESYSAASWLRAVRIVSKRAHSVFACQAERGRVALEVRLVHGGSVRHDGQPRCCKARARVGSSSYDVVVVVVWSRHLSTDTQHTKVTCRVFEKKNGSRCNEFEIFVPRERTSSVRCLFIHDPGHFSGGFDVARQAPRAQDGLGVTGVVNLLAGRAPRPEPDPAAPSGCAEP